SSSAPFAPWPLGPSTPIVARVRSVGVAIAMGIGAALVCAALAPVVVNGDGLGYLRAAPLGVLAPGHLGYLPLLRWVARVAHAQDARTLLGPARLLSHV